MRYILSVKIGGLFYCTRLMNWLVFSMRALLGVGTSISKMSSVILFIFLAHHVKAQISQYGRLCLKSRQETLKCSVQALFWVCP
uniref:Uncharacterized protein n=1 Tax=Octopus bimaculoides TaxID=37653 RepID=A0A0L8GZ88_OCTBM